MSWRFPLEVEPLLVTQVLLEIIKMNKSFLGVPSHGGFGLFSLRVPALEQTSGGAQLPEDLLAVFGVAGLGVNEPIRDIPRDAFECPAQNLREAIEHGLEMAPGGVEPREVQSDQSEQEPESQAKERVE